MIATDRTKNLDERVAEALGCNMIWQPASPLIREHEPYAGYWTCNCFSEGRRGLVHGLPGYGIHSYSKSWAVTGPLLDEYEISIEKLVWDNDPVIWTARHEVGWDPDGGSESTTGCEAVGPTPLIAICNLILALKEQK